MTYQLLFIVLSTVMLTNSWGSALYDDSEVVISSGISPSALPENDLGDVKSFAERAAAHHKSLEDSIEDLKRTIDHAKNPESVLARELLPKHETDLATLGVKIVCELIDGVQENQHNGTFTSYVKEHLSVLVKITKSLSPVVIVTVNDLITTITSWVPTDIFYRNLSDGMVEMYAIEKLKRDIEHMATTIKKHREQDVFNAYALAVQHINTMTPEQQGKHRHHLLHAFICSDHTLEQNFDSVRNSAFMRLLQITRVILKIQPQ